MSENEESEEAQQEREENETQDYDEDEDVSDKSEEDTVITEESFNVNDVISAYNQGYRVAKDRLKDFRVENGVASRFSEEEDGIDYEESKSGDAYQDALENMGDSKFLNNDIKLVCYRLILLIFLFYLLFYINSN